MSSKIGLSGFFITGPRICLACRRAPTLLTAGLGLFRLDFYLILAYHIEKQLKINSTKNKFMGHFNRDERGGGRGFGGGGRFGGRDRGFGGKGGGRQTMFQATCSQCNKFCEVPFKPTGERPVFCDECFRSQRQDRREKMPRQDFGRSNFGEEQRQRIGSSQNIEQFRSQFEVLNVKLDKIIKMLVPAVTAVSASEEVKSEPEKMVKKAKEKTEKKTVKKISAQKKK